MDDDTLPAKVSVMPVLVVYHHPQHRSMPRFLCVEPSGRRENYFVNQLGIITKPRILFTYTEMKLKSRALETIRGNAVIPPLLLSLSLSDSVSQMGGGCRTGELQADTLQTDIPDQVA